MKKLFVLLMVVFTLFIFVGCEGLNMLGGNTAKFVAETEELENNKANIKINVKSSKKVEDFETYEEYVDYIIDSIESFQKKVLKDEELKGNEEIIKESIALLIEEVKACETSEEIMEKLDAWFVEVDKTFYVELSLLRGPYIELAAKLLISANELVNEDEELKAEIVEKITDFADDVEDDLTEEEFKALADEIIAFVQEKGLLEVFISDIVDFMVNSKRFESNENHFVDGKFNKNSVKRNDEELKGYKERVCNPMFELAYEAKKNVEKDEEKLNEYKAVLVELANELLNATNIEELEVKLLELVEKLEELRTLVIEEEPAPEEKPEAEEKIPEDK